MSNPCPACLQRHVGAVCFYKRLPPERWVQLTLDYEDGVDAEYEEQEDRWA